jgi:LCP family protein required for cell wall assembly
VPRPSWAAGLISIGSWPSRRSRILAWTSIGLSVVLVIGVLGVYFDVRAKLDSIGRIAIADDSHRPPRYTDAVNILLLGSDSRTGGNARIGGRVGCDCSDTIMLAHISPGRGKVTVLSIPRDTMVPQYACTAVQGTPGQPSDPSVYERINATLEAGGPECVRTTVEQQTGIYINNTVMLNFTGFEKVINDVGGVRVCVPVAISDPITPGPEGHGSGLKLKAGRDHLWGRQALQFWRARYALADGSDLARISRDQYLMGQIFKGVLHKGLLSSPATLYRVFGDLARSIATDASTSDLIGIASSLRHVSSKNVQFATALTVPYPADPGAELEFEQPQAKAVFAAIARDKKLPEVHAKKGKKSAKAAKTRATAVAPAQVKVTVLNGTLIGGLAAGAASQLTSRGFVIIGQPADAATTGYVESIIEYSQPADRAAALTLAKQVSGAQVKLAPGVSAGTVTLILGSAFTSLATSAAAKAKGTASKPLGTIAGSYKASSSCRNSSFFGPNLPKPTSKVSCTC